jgi:squalene cyclase
MYDSVDLLLTLQNPNGGFASYELVRAPIWIEQLNAAEVFGASYSNIRPCFTAVNCPQAIL